MKYYFLGKPFQTGQVKKYILKKQNYTVIIGLDMGHGETVIYLYKKEDPLKDKWSQMAPVHPDGSNKITPTYIHYEADKAPADCIGHTAALKDDFSVSFKYPPTIWHDPKDEEIPKDIIDNHGHSCDELLHDYIQKLILDARENNDSIRTALSEENKNNTLIVVGCPASDAWTSAESDEKYKNLLASATGHPREHIAILPESTAAIMSVVYNTVVRDKGKKGRPDLSNGMLIADIGSSTGDVTYILLGKVIYTASLPLGGSHIEEGMLRKIMADKHIDKIPDEMRPKLLAQLRKDKEEFYEGKRKKKDTLYDIPKTTAEGRQTTEDYDFIVDQAFLDAVLKEDKCHRLSGAQGKSWYELYDEFFRETEKKLKGRPLGSVVLTGGTGNVTQLQECFQKYYNTYTMEKNTSDSVAKGLCYAKSLETRAAEKIGLAEERLNKEHGKYYKKTFLPALAEALFLKEAEIIDTAIRPLYQKADLSLDLLQKKADHALQENDAKIDEVFKEVFLEHCKHRYQKIEEAVNGLSAEIYETTLDPEAGIQLDSTDIMVPDAIAVNLNLKKLFRGSLLLRSFHLATWIFTRKDPDREKKKCQQIIQAYSTEEGRRKLCKKQSETLEKALKKNDGLQTLYNEMNEAQFEAALGKVLLLVTNAKI